MLAFDPLGDRVIARIEHLAIALRPGAMLGLVVTSMVGLVGLVQWDQSLMLIGLIAGPLLFALNAVLVGISNWHRRNTEPEATYVSAEDMVRLQRLQSQRAAAQTRRPRRLLSSRSR